MTTMSGEDFDMIVIHVTQDRLDGDKVRELLAPEDLKKVYKTISFKTIKCARRDPKRKPKFKMPNLGNATPEGLVDMLGKVREEMADLKKLEGIYKEALEARLVAEPSPKD